MQRNGYYCKVRDFAVALSPAAPVTHLNNVSFSPYFYAVSILSYFAIIGQSIHTAFVSLSHANKLSHSVFNYQSYFSYLPAVQDRV